MSGYTKLFSSIVTSSIWCEDDATVRVWIAMLALADADGIVEGSLPGFASVARVSLEDMQKAEKVLAGPDEFSRTTVHEGRRIEKIDGGWRILNYHSYREKPQGDTGSRAPYFREYRRRQKAQHVAQQKNVVRNTEEEDRSKKKIKASNKQQSSVESEASNTHRSGDHDENRFRWDKAKQEFTGDHEAIREKLAKLGYYDEPLGREWINAVWWRINDWAKTEMRNGKPRIETYRDYKAFVLKWFMREAQRKRELER